VPKVKIRMTAEGFCNYTGPTHREFSERVFENLCKKFGTPGISWYPTTTGAIKTFHDGNWHLFRDAGSALGWW